MFSCTYLETEEEEFRDSVLVTDGDIEIGQVMLPVLQNFLSRLHLEVFNCGLLCHLR